MYLDLLIIFFYNFFQVYFFIPPTLTSHTSTPAPSRKVSTMRPRNPSSGTLGKPGVGNKRGSAGKPLPGSAFTPSYKYTTKLSS